MCEREIQSRERHRERRVDICTLWVLESVVRLQFIHTTDEVCQLISSNQVHDKLYRLLYCIYYAPGIYIYMEHQ